MNRGNALGSFADHPGGFCLDNTADPGWCVWCGREILPPGDEPAEAAVPAPASAPLGTSFPVAMVVRPAEPEPDPPAPKPPAWYVQMTRLRRTKAGDAP